MLGQIVCCLVAIAIDFRQISTDKFNFNLFYICLNCKENTKPILIRRFQQNRLISGASQDGISKMLKKTNGKAAQKLNGAKGLSKKGEF